MFKARLLSCLTSLKFHRYSKTQTRGKGIDNLSFPCRGHRVEPYTASSHLLLLWKPWRGHSGLGPGHSDQARGRHVCSVSESPNEGQEIQGAKSWVMFANPINGIFILCLEWLLSWEQLGVGGKGTPGGVSSEKVRKGIHSKTRGKRMEMEESIGIYTKSWKGVNRGHDFSCGKVVCWERGRRAVLRGL